ncbi:hypothetical protein HAX54_012097 [Datura stramonium]|uniref:Uncharacterized protein n=1 Tax=Datura stramonium TaxID=4076 RepID=A0ABS8Y5A6_DATST|nr:hypothetical protein [Datura stramonium]
MHEPKLTSSCTILKVENSKLEDLRTLSRVRISYSEDMSDALEKFPNVQHLECTIVEPMDPPTHGDWFPKLDVLNKLETIIADYENTWSYSYYAVEPESIVEVPPPNEYHFPTSSKELRLYNFPMRLAFLSAIVALPQLEILEFNGSELPEDKCNAREDIFQSLKSLSLIGVYLSEGQVYTETFPQLEQLMLEDIRQLKEIPSTFGNIDTLKSIHLDSVDQDLVDSSIEMKHDVAGFKGEDRLDVHVHVPEVVKVPRVVDNLVKAQTDATNGIGPRMIRRYGYKAGKEKKHNI